MTLNCNGTLVDLSAPKILGILNLTSDSFYDGGKHNKKNAALEQCEKMLERGPILLILERTVQNRCYR